MAHHHLASVNFVFNSATATAIGVIVSALATAIVRVTVVKGKFRAQAADVLVDATVHERQLKELYFRQYTDLRTALVALSQVIDFDNFSDPNASERLEKANKIARRALAKKYTVGAVPTDALIDEAER